MFDRYVSKEYKSYEFFMNKCQVSKLLGLKAGEDRKS